MSDSQNKLAINKLIILFLVERMEKPFAGSQISQFALEREYTDYFSLQQYLEELIDVGYLTKSKEENSTYYAITEEGSVAVSCLINLLPDSAILEINNYVLHKRKEHKRSLDVAANYFEITENEYSVKCGVYESDGTIMIELSLVVFSKEQAKTICNNWKTNPSKFYGAIFNMVSKNYDEADF